MGAEGVLMVSLKTEPVKSVRGMVSPPVTPGHILPIIAGERLRIQTMSKLYVIATTKDAIRCKLPQIHRQKNY